MVFSVLKGPNIIPTLTAILAILILVPRFILSQGKNVDREEIRFQPPVDEPVTPGVPEVVFGYIDNVVDGHHWIP